MADQITRSDVDAVAGKLEEFARDLPEDERQVLGWILARAEKADEDEVSGYLQTLSGSGFTGGLNQQLIRSTGLTGPLGGQAATVTVSWSW